MQDVITIINTVGFPIACVMFLGFYINKLSSQHKEESEKFAEALNNNTLVLQKLCDKMDMEREVK